MKAVLDLAQTVTICVVGGAAIYLIVQIRQTVGQLRAGQKTFDKR
jgi:hypothetical protein